MTDDTVDKRRRHFLVTATTVVGGAGLVAFAIPFIQSMEPGDARAFRMQDPDGCDFESDKGLR